MCPGGWYRRVRAPGGRNQEWDPGHRPTRECPHGRRKRAQRRQREQKSTICHGECRRMGRVKFGG
jgi:hypothetical protein